ncbi:MAG TPA: nuclear transport factor 2 family protein [Candidatus Methylomirabilis sp.]|nr:nuclear transport factor 2 family protein [Candidatus Methylomirabilis sp.]
MQNLAQRSVKAQPARDWKRATTARGTGAAADRRPIDLGLITAAPTSQREIRHLTAEEPIRVRAFWEQFFARSPQARIDTEEIFAVGVRCVVRWAYHWVREGKAGHVRGVDIFRVRDQEVVEKLSYVKG